MPEPIHPNSIKAHPPLYPETGTYRSREADFFDDHDRVSLCDMLDRLLNKGIVVTGEVTISVADIDLLYLGVNLVLTSMETARIHSGGSGLVRIAASTKGGAHGSL
jgi:hypothetical protein